MKQTDLSKLVLFLFFCLVLAACDDNEVNRRTVHLRLNSSSCEVMLDGSATIRLTANEDVTLTIQNPDVVSASYQCGNFEDILPSITIHGKQKGRTTISITDNKTQETAQLTVEVIDKYLTYFIMDSNHPELKASITLFLVNNENRDCYFSQTDKQANKQKVFAQGTYNFLMEKHDDILIPYLTLTYGFKEEGDITNALPQPTLHKFEIVEVDRKTFYYIKDVLDVDWENLLGKVAARNNFQFNLPMVMKESESNYFVEGAFVFSTEIPAGVMP